MNRRLFLLAGLGTLPLAALPARAAKGTVALLPAHVTVGAPANGGEITSALRASLEKHGFTVLPEGNVASELKAQGIDLRSIQSDAKLAKVREALGADFLVYPRVLSVGVGIGTPQQFQANIIVNVEAKTGKSFIHTRQVGQVFNPRGASREAAALSHSDAENAVAKLMEGFYAKAGK